MKLNSAAAELRRLNESISKRVRCWPGLLFKYNSLQACVYAPFLSAMHRGAIVAVGRPSQTYTVIRAS
jgi:hypothetical protein